MPVFGRTALAVVSFLLCFQYDACAQSRSTSASALEAPGKVVAQSDRASQIRVDLGDNPSPGLIEPGRDLQAAPAVNATASKKKSSKAKKNKSAEETTQVQAPAPVAPPAPKGEPYDLGKAVGTALDRNPRIVAAQEQIERDKRLWYASIGQGLPTAKVGYGYQHLEPPRVAGTGPTRTDDQYFLYFKVENQLFNGFKDLNSAFKADLQRGRSEANFNNEELSLIQTVQQNFFSLLQAREDIRSAKDSVERLKSQLQVTQAFYDVGLKPRLDVLTAEVDLATAENTLVQNENTYATQVARLNTLLDQPLDAAIDYQGELIYTPFSLTIDQCLDEAMKNRPDLMIFRKLTQIAEKDKEIAGGDLLPKLLGSWEWRQFGSRGDLQGDAITELNRYDQWTLTAAVEWQIFDFGANFFKWRAALHAMKVAMAQEANTRLEAVNDVKAKHLKIGETAKRITVAKKGVEQAREGYRMAVARYQAQVGTNTEVLDSQSRLTSAEASLTQALVGYRTALANLYTAIGRKNPKVESQ